MGRVKPRWPGEEIRITVRKEAGTKGNGVYFINKHLLKYCRGQRTLGAIQNIRNKPSYEELMETILDDLRAVFEAAQALSSASGTPYDSSESDTSPLVNSTLGL